MTASVGCCPLLNVYFNDANKQAVKFLRAAFWQNTSGGCFWNFIITSVSLHYYISFKKFQEQPFAYVLQKRCSYKFRKIHRKTPVSVTCLVIFLYFSLFIEHLQATASEIHRVTFLRIFFSLSKSILLHRRYLISKFSEILIGTGFQKNIFCFFQWNFSQQLWFSAYVIV